MEISVEPSHGMEEEIREETVPLDQDSCGQCEPDGSHDWSSGQKFLHGISGMKNQRIENASLISEVKQ